MKKLLSCRIDEEKMTKLLIRSAEETIKRREKVGIGELIEAMMTDVPAATHQDNKKAGTRVTDDVEMTNAKERIKRLSEELEKRDEVVKEMTMELNQLRDANQAWQRDNAKLKAERKAEENPGLAASENIVLRKKVAQITAGVLKDGEKMEKMEKLMEMMEGWELPVFESWQVAMRTKRMNGKQEKATMDQEISA